MAIPKIRIDVIIIALVSWKLDCRELALIASALVAKPRKHERVTTLVAQIFSSR